MSRSFYFPWFAAIILSTLFCLITLSLTGCDDSEDTDDGAAEGDTVDENATDTGKTTDANATGAVETTDTDAKGAEDTTDANATDAGDTTNTDTTDNEDTTDTNTTDSFSEPYCEWEEYKIPVGTSITYDLPECLSCKNYMLVRCDYVGSDGSVAAIPEESDCLCRPESCPVEALQETIYAGSSYNDNDRCCHCTTEWARNNEGAINCVEGPCGTSGLTCEYDGEQYQVGEFGPGFPCDVGTTHCLCEEANGVASWKCAKCSNAKLPTENDAMEIGGHCCTHLKYGSPAFDSSYIQCKSGACQE